MKEDQFSLVIALRERQIMPAQFLLEFGATDGSALSLQLLRDGDRLRASDDVEAGLTVGFVFGFVQDHVELLLSLALAPWHVSYETIVRALENIGNPLAIPVLHKLTQWVPSYLHFDDTRALARHAYWAISKIGGPGARDSLVQIAASLPDRWSREVRDILAAYDSLNDG
ncbi:MAG: HEAT repeat domain-containing protein [Phycisphaerales bacterium]|nr:HEAT repeat domain-containing protein [Phycisphaerales bacterium]